MAGIYIHIPFCRQACHYCDFHFSTNLSRQEEMVAAIGTEIEKRSNYLNDVVSTVYFGGGTPSLLSQKQLKHLLDVVHSEFSIDPDAEITLEANPEDLSKDKSSQLFDIGINRLSIGIQTFHDEKLAWMNRAHNSHEALLGYENARESGFNNISLDLIYAIPNHIRKAWEEDLEKITSLNPEHISLYGLTIENKTVFGKWEKEKKLIEVPENEAAEQYLFSIEYLKKHGYLQYEVSNFGKAGFHSRHNNSYWAGIPYLGVGPGAHSFDGEFTRQFNVRNNSKYLKGIAENSSISESEQLSHNQRLNEQILTGLRTTQGIDLKNFEKSSGYSIEEMNGSFIAKMEAQNMIEVRDGHIRLKPNGFLVADEIALRLFISE